MLLRSLFQTCLLLLLASVPAMAHFGMVIPSNPIADQANKQLQAIFSFSHPFSGIGMDMTKPNRTGVLHNGHMSDLTDTLIPATVMGHKAWRADYIATRPGAHILFMEPQPYWEPSEDAFIIHYTKTIAPAFGVESGWDALVGFPIEIKPLLRPFGNYAGNLYTAQVFFNNKPLSDTEVEIEYYNQNNQFAAPTPYHETQVVKTNSDGIFSFVCPQPGWWGFAALATADYQLPDPKGHPKPVELGAVLWVYMDAWKER
jgi:cobalt/nickel transport protein